MRLTLLSLLISASFAPSGAAAGHDAERAAPALSYAQTLSFRELAALQRRSDAAIGADESDAYAEAIAQPLRPASADEARAEVRAAAAGQLVPLGEFGEPPRWAMLLAGGAVAVFLARRVAGASA